MLHIKRPFAAVGAAAVLALSLTACGGGASGAPEDASEKDFCDAYQGYVKSLTDMKGEKPTEKEFDGIVASVEEMGEVGTPKGISEDERAGFEVFVDEITALSYDDVKDKDSDDELVNVSEEDDKNVDKFGTYVSETCAEDAAS